MKTLGLTLIIGFMSMGFLNIHTNTNTYTNVYAAQPQEALINLEELANSEGIAKIHEMLESKQVTKDLLTGVIDGFEANNRMVHAIATYCETGQKSSLQDTIELCYELLTYYLTFTDEIIIDGIDVMRPIG